MIFHARLLVIECTFLDDAVDHAGAKARGHMHVRDLAAHADKFQVRHDRLYSTRVRACDAARARACSLVQVYMPCSALMCKAPLQNEAILLMHFSARYRPQEILDHLDRELPAQLRAKVYPFLQGFSFL